MSWSMLNRSWVLYAALVLFIWMSPTHVQLVANAKAESLSRLTPPMDYFAEFVNKKEGFDRKKTEDCIYYHRRVIDIIPTQRAEAYTMLGFCYERAGENAKAIDAYLRSLKFNPSYFWSDYNIGALYYNQKNYEKARFYLERATAQDPVRASLIPLMSKVYRDVMAGPAAKGFDIGESLAQGYQRAFILLVLCSQQLRDYPFMLATALHASGRGRGGDQVFFYYAAVAAYEMGSFDKAVALLQKFLGVSPNSTEGMHYLALSLRAMGQEEAAKGVLAKADRLLAQYGPSLPDLSHAPVQFF